MGQATSHDEFEWKHDLEPHRSRRTLMLKEYPEIKKLFVVDQSFKWKATGLVLFQFMSLFMFRDLPWWAIVALAYFVGGTINHSLMLAMHESSHMHAFGYQYPLLNRLFSIFVNLPIGIPSACAFKKYHNLHHRFLGQDGVDTDLPTEWEGRVFRHPIMKALWLFCQPITYGVRPFLVKPMPVCILEAFNIAVQITFDIAVYWVCGPKMLAYLLVGTWLTMGLHPLGGHFITEHFLWPRFEAKGKARTDADSDSGNSSEHDITNVTDGNYSAEQIRRLKNAEGNETFSYYGPLNLLTWNVGYHVAHHDFPAIPGSLLPEVHRIAPEWYENVPAHTSWTWALVEFITDSNLGPFCRVKRNNLPSEQSADE